jgi:hypothetical protein
MEKPAELGRSLAALMIDDGAADLMGTRQRNEASEASELDQGPIDTTGGEPATLESET